MILSLLPTDLVIIHNWEVVSVIYKIQPGNITKHWFAPLPDFDIETYPFLVCSGRENFMLINVERFTIEQLVLAPCMNVRSQEAFFFKDESFGFSMHFATKELTEENTEYQMWHMLSFKSDFDENLRKYSRLPISSLNKKLRLKQQHNFMKQHTQLSFTDKKYSRQQIDRLKRYNTKFLPSKSLQRISETLKNQAPHTKLGKRFSITSDDTQRNPM